MENIKDIIDIKDIKDIIINALDYYDQNTSKYKKYVFTNKIRLVENPRTFIEEYLESILKGKAKDNEIVDHGLEEDEDIEINGIVKKQIKSLKNSMKTFGLKPGHILKGLKDDNE